MYKHLFGYLQRRYFNATHQAKIKMVCIISHWKDCCCMP